MPEGGERGMPLELTIDHPNRGILALGCAPVSAADLVRFADDVMRLELYAYTKLIHLAGCSAHFDAAELTSSVLALHLIETRLAHGRVAVVVDRRWPDYRMLHDSLERGGWPFLLTDNIHDARHWLDDHGLQSGRRQASRPH